MVKLQDNETVRDNQKKPADRCRDIEKSVIKQFRKEIWRPFVKALNEYDMIQEGDNIAVCISGGKDSMLLAKCMQEILRHGKMEFGLHFLVMDPGYNPENRKMIEENAKIMGIPITVFESDIFNVVVDVDQSPATCAPECAGAISMPTQSGWDAIRLPWATILTTSSRRFS